eukprot:gene14859-20918_t
MRCDAGSHLRRATVCRVSKGVKLAVAGYKDGVLSSVYIVPENGEEGSVYRLIRVNELEGELSFSPSEVFSPPSVSQSSQGVWLKELSEVFSPPSVSQSSQQLATIFAASTSTPDLPNPGMPFLFGDGSLAAQAMPSLARPSSQAAKDDSLLGAVLVSLSAVFLGFCIVYSATIAPTLPSPMYPTITESRSTYVQTSPAPAFAPVAAPVPAPIPAPAPAPTKSLAPPEAPPAAAVVETSVISRSMSFFPGFGAEAFQSISRLAPSKAPSPMPNCYYASVADKDKSLGLRHTSVADQCKWLGLRRTSVADQGKWLGLRHTSVADQCKWLGLRRTYVADQGKWLGLRHTSVADQCKWLGLRHTHVADQGKWLGLRRTSVADKGKWLGLRHTSVADKGKWLGLRHTSVADKGK